MNSSYVSFYNDEHYIYCVESFMPLDVYFKNLKICRSQDYVIMLEKNYDPVLYFHRSDINNNYIEEYKNNSFIISKNVNNGDEKCPYKGNITWYSIVYNKEIEEKAGWSYNKPPEYIKTIENLMAFYNNKIDVFYKGNKISTSDVLNKILCVE